MVKLQKLCALLSPKTLAMGSHSQGSSRHFCPHLYLWRAEGRNLRSWKFRWTLCLLVVVLRPDEPYSQKMVRDCGSRLPVNLHLGRGTRSHGQSGKENEAIRKKVNGGRRMHFYFLKSALYGKRHIQPGAHTNVVDFASLLRGKSRRAELGKTHLEQEWILSWQKVVDLARFQLLTAAKKKTSEKIASIL